MIGILLCALLNHAAAGATIEVDASRCEATPVPRTFFGQFGEHLGCNIYNGQWAQILRNPSFEAYEFYEPEAGPAKGRFGLPDVAAGRDLGLACYWLPEGEATYAMDVENPFNSALSQRIETRSTGGVRTPVMLPLHRVRQYDLSFYARAAKATTATVLFRTRDGQTICESPMPIEGPSWKRYARRLALPEGPGAGDLCYLVLQFEGPATAWLDHAELFPVDHVNGHDPDVIRLMRELNVSLLRFPGGNFVSGYHWRDGIGPREKRVTMSNPAWPISECNHYGTDDWMAFAQAIGAEPMLCVNAGNGTPDEAADWIRYCNEPPTGPLGKLRAANGHPEPYKVHYWEVGNELYGHWQIGHCTAEDYAARYDTFAKAMRTADPSIYLIANGCSRDWNVRVLKAAKEPVQCISAHYLIGSSSRDAAVEDMGTALASYGIEFERQLAAMRGAFRAIGRADVKLAVTELMSTSVMKSAPRSHSCHAENLYFAGMMNACIRQRDFIELVTRTAVINHGGGRAKIFEVAFPEPVHFLSSLYGTMSGRRPVACRVHADRCVVPPVAGLPPMGKVPVLDTVALLDDDGGELTLLVTNRDAGASHTATISIDGFSPADSARTRTIAAPPNAFNVWNEPPRVKTVEARVPAGQAFDYAFPPASITEILLTR